jgi:hypothetical protein
MELNRDFREFFESLARHDVRILVVGGYAMAAHGHPRFTKDLDVWVWMDPVNSEAILAALDEFGFGSLGLTRGDFLTADTVVQLGNPGHRVRGVLAGTHRDRGRRCRRSERSVVAPGYGPADLSRQRRAAVHGRPRGA